MTGWMLERAKVLIDDEIVGVTSLITQSYNRLFESNVGFRVIAIIEENQFATLFLQ